MLPQQHTRVDGNELTRCPWSSSSGGGRGGAEGRMREGGGGSGAGREEVGEEKREG